MTLLTIKELSLLLKVKQSTLYAWANRGMIPSFKLNGLLRFDEEEIDEWIQSLKVMPKKRFIMKKTIGSRRIKVDDIVNKIIEDTKKEGYNSKNKKPGFNQGLRKEA